MASWGCHATVYRWVTRVLAVVLLPAAWLVAPGRAQLVARWLERHGARHHLYRVYDNEWWHFEYRPEGRPPRLPHPGLTVVRCPTPDSG